MARATLFFILFSLVGLSLPSYARPRIGYETELARHNQSGQILHSPSEADRAALTREILNRLSTFFGGEVRRDDHGRIFLNRKTGAFRIDKDWASDSPQPDALEDQVSIVSILLLLLIPNLKRRTGKSK